MVRIFYTNFHLGWGGQSLQVMQLARAMSDRGHQTTIFSPPDSELARRAAEAGLEVSTACRFRQGFRPRSLMGDFHKLRSIIKSEGCDLIHAHGSQDTWTAIAATLGLRGQVALVRTKHNSYPARRHAANRWLYNRALDHTIAVAGPIRDELVGDGFVSSERVSVIHAGLDDDFATRKLRTREEICREHNLPVDGKLVGLVGRLAPDKGQDVLLSAAVKLRERWPDAHYLLIGTGGDWSRIEAMIKELELEDIVHWLGFQDDVASFTGALDIAVLAARACDASSTVIKEAMALGVPVVATDVGGTVEIVDHGRCGILVEPGSAVELAKGLEVVFERPAEVASRVDAARAHVSRYFASAIAEETEAIYRKVMAQLKGLPVDAAGAGA